MNPNLRATRIVIFAVLVAVISLLTACSREPTVKADQFDFETIRKREEAQRQEDRANAKRTIQLHSFTLDPAKTVEGKKLDEELVYHETYIVDLDLRLDEKPPELLAIIFVKQMPTGRRQMGGGDLRLVEKRQGSCRFSGLIRPGGVGDATMTIMDLRVKGGRVIYSCPVTFSAAPPEKKGEK